jgi:flagellar basal-body rod protein FlgF
MPSTPYVLASRKMGLFDSLSRLADNVANAETAGYKREGNIFRALVAEPGGAKGPKTEEFSVVAKTQRDFSQGVLKQTDRVLDFALAGQGFFMADTPLGVRYMRGGNFVLDKDGVLSTKEGYPVLATGGGTIAFAPEDTDVNVREDGSIYAGAEQRGTLAVASFEDTDALERTGTGFYRTDATPDGRPERTRVMQGMLEEANVSAVVETTKLTEISRDIEAVKQAESSYHRLATDALRRLGDTR